jgi:streptogrisin C
MLTRCRMLPLCTVLVAVGGPSVASAQQGQPDWIEQAKVVAQMEGVTVGEAVRRTNLQNKALREVERFSSDPDYAGSWIERDARNFKIHFAFKGSKAGAKTVTDPDLKQDSEVREARYSIRELEAERQRLASVLQSASLKAAFSIRAKENELLVHAGDAAAVGNAFTNAGGAAPFVRIVNRVLYATPEAAVYGAGPVSGAQNCTAGFTVTSSSGRGISTAGHCPLMSTHRGLPIGSRIAEMNQGPVDVSWYRNSSNTYHNAIPYGTSYYIITSVTPRAIPTNTSTCVMRRTDVLACAYVAEAYFYDGSGRGPLVRVDRHPTVSTDSGGPWFYGSVAHGIHGGGVCYDEARTDCPYAWFTAAPELSRMGISVLTTQ